MSDRKTLEIVCTNCGDPWETNHAEVCELRDGVWLEAQSLLNTPVSGFPEQGDSERR